MRSITWLTSAEMERLSMAHGYAAEPVLPPNVLEGWIFSPEQELSALQLYVNDEGVAYVPLWDRPDVAAVYPRFPHAVRSGYHLMLPSGLLRGNRVNQVTVVGFHDGEARVRKKTLVFDDDLAPAVPIPPPELIKRTQGDEDGVLYRKLGYLFYREMLDLLAKYRDPQSIRRVLDWGCGSGRVAANFLADAQKYEVHACDPHPESIAWCQAHLPAGRFRVSPGQPPLPYADTSFDLVLALGVVYLFSHDELLAWLAELKRILAKRGILILTIQGAFAAKVRFPPEALALLQRDGVLDADRADAGTGAAADAKLYRKGYFWKPAYIKEMASRHFRVHDYQEGAFTSDHDLIIAERVD